MKPGIWISARVVLMLSLLLGMVSAASATWYTSTRISATINNDRDVTNYKISPNATVSTFACGSRPSLACHDLARYSEQRPICPSGQGARPLVPGTRITGDRKSQPLREPPTPGC